MDFAVLVTRGPGVEGHLRLDAACGVHPVSEDEAAFASADAGSGWLLRRQQHHCFARAVNILGMKLNFPFNSE